MTANPYPPDRVTVGRGRVRVDVDVPRSWRTGEPLPLPGYWFVALLDVVNAAAALDDAIRQACDDALEAGV